MLKNLKEASNNWFIKILFSAIIFSFCLWGIGDIIRNYSATKPVAKVGRSSISSDSFIREYNKIKQNLKNKENYNISKEEIKKINIKDIVIDNFINEAVLAETFKKYKISIPKKIISQLITSMPEFQKNGLFDKNLYLSVLSNSGINQAILSQNIKNNLAQTQLFHPIIAGYNIPSFIKKIIVDNFNLKKTLLITKIKLSDIKLNQKIDENDINEYYNSHSNDFKKPESRDASILILDCSRLFDNIVITEQEISEYYENNKESFQETETRSFERLAFEAPFDADKAWEMMKTKNISTSEIKKKFAANLEKLDVMERSNFSKETGNELFSMKNINEVSTVYKVGDQYFIYRLTEITKPNDSKTDKEIRTEIKNILLNEKMNTPEFYQQVKEFKNKIDDSLSSGKTIDEVAKEFNLKTIALKEITKENKKEMITTDEATEKELTEAIFNTEESQTSVSIDSHETDYISYIVYINKINKERIPALNEIHETVKNNCLKAKKNEIAKEKIEELTDNTQDSLEKISKLPETKSYTVSKKDIIFYNSKEQNSDKETAKLLKDIPNQNLLLDLLSNLKIGESKYFADEVTGDYTIITVKKTTKPQENDTKFNELLDKYLDNGCQNDILIISKDAFKTEFKVKINEKLINSLTSRVEDNDDEDDYS